MASSKLGILVPNGKRGSANGRQKEDIDLPLFDFTTIVHATSDFSDNNKLGEGGFRPVYKESDFKAREYLVHLAGRALGASSCDLSLLGARGCELVDCHIPVWSAAWSLGARGFAIVVSGFQYTSQPGRWECKGST